jgi:hypothetical protein
VRRWCRRPDGPRARTRPKLHRVIDLLRTGAWLTLDRIRAYSTVLLIGYAVTFIVLFATAHGNNDMFGRPIGTDFSVVYVAGKSVLAGHPAQPYDLAQYAQAAQAMFGAATPEYGWFYPPSFLVPAALLALLPYKLAFLMWQGVGLAAFAILCAACLHWRRAWLPVLAFPAVFVCLGHGQNGFCTAALFAGGLLALDRRPLLAGVLFGLLAYKPQLATVIPASLLAGLHGRAILSATVTVAVTTAATLGAFGLKTWISFAGAARIARVVVVEQGNPGWEKMQSAFAAARMWHASVPAAYVAQGVVTISVLAALVWLWRWPHDRRLRGAALMVGALLATPYCMDYDMTLLGPALALAVDFAIERGFLPWEKTMLAFVWIAPLLARVVAGEAGVPLGLLSMLCLFGMVSARAWKGRAVSSVAA